jgi:uncharacterized membrane-anchored protein YhcB (DUF1043 family)
MTSELWMALAAGIAIGIILGVLSLCLWEDKT